MKKNILVLFLAVSGSLLLGEFIARIYGVVPGFAGGPTHFRRVDTVIVQRGYAADSCARPFVANDIRDLVNEVSDNVFQLSRYPEIVYNVLCNTSFENVCGEFTEVPLHLLRLKKNAHAFELGRAYIAASGKSQRSDFDSALLNYLQHPINSFGYKSLAFRKKSSRKRVFMLGDSFTWGFSTDNRFNSFPDLLLARGYEVYNTGLSAADVPQYMAVARKFIPEYKPDVVVANIYLGNDIMYFKQELMPYQTHIYATNAGYLPPCPLGVRLPTPDSSYRFVLDAVSIPATTTFNSWCYNSALLTLVWRALQSYIPKEYLKGAGRIDFEKIQATKKMDTPYINTQMKELRQLCNEQGSRLIIAIIPNFMMSETGNSISYVKNYSQLFTDEIFYEPKMILEEDYSHAGDGHFNDTGHKKYADFIQQIIDTI